MRNIRLRSFFDVAFLLKFNCYIKAVSTRSHATRYTINSHPLLLLAIDDHNNPLAYHFLELGADPNIRSYRLSGTIWEHVIGLARSEQDECEQKRLYELTLALIKHGADISLLTDQDFDTVLFDLEQEEKDALAARVNATMTKTKRKNHNVTTSSTSTRKSLKHRFSTIFKGKTKKHI